MRLRENPNWDTTQAVQLLAVRSSRARVAKLTELLLKGYRWNEVKRSMMLSHAEFTALLSAAVYWAYREAMRADPDHTGCIGPFDWPRGEPVSDADEVRGRHPQGL
jgi:hypothetical protein